MKFLSMAFASLMLNISLAANATEDTQFQMIEGYGGVPLNVMTKGDPSKPGILFIHGMSQAAQAFRPQFDSALADEFYLVAFDMRGHGLSGKPWQPEQLVPSQAWAGDVAAVMAVTGLEKPVVVAWSYGGFVASDYLRHYGTDNIAGINLVGSLGGLVPNSVFGNSGGEVSPEMAEVFKNSARTRSMDLYENVTGSQGVAASFYTDSMTQADKDAQVAMGLMMPSYVRRNMAGRQLNNMDIADQVTMPVLLSRGSEDLMMPESDTQATLDTLPEVTLSFYEDTGHLPFFQHPERYNAELMDFAKRVTATD